LFNRLIRAANTGFKKNEQVKPGNRHNPEKEKRQGPQVEQRIQLWRKAGRKQVIDSVL
jgi:hypothetical protein